MNPWSGRVASVLAMALLFGCSSTTGEGDGSQADKCVPDDEDGVMGGSPTFVRSIDDTQFLPASNAVIKVQNLSDITLTITNVGTKPHDFSVDCLPTPNDDGCATTSCFPPEAHIPSVDPGASVTVKFTVPLVEGLYTYRSDLPGDTQTSQFDVD